jgi:hypothetical protein
LPAITELPARNIEPESAKYDLVFLSIKQFTSSLFIVQLSLYKANLFVYILRYPEYKL